MLKNPPTICDMCTRPAPTKFCCALQLNGSMLMYKLSQLQNWGQGGELA